MTEAEKEFQKADIENAKKRAEQLQYWADLYKQALKDVVFAKTSLKSVVDRAKDAGFKEDVLKAVIVSQNLLGVDQMAFLSAINPTEGQEPCAE